MNAEILLEWQKGIKKLQETNGEITDEDLIETYQDYRNSFQDLYEELDSKLDECGIS